MSTKVPEEASVSPAGNAMCPSHQLHQQVLRMHNSPGLQKAQTGNATSDSRRDAMSRAAFLLLILIMSSLISLGTPSIASAASITWQLQPGRATDVGVGSNGETWIIGNNPVPGGYGIYHLVNGSWVSVPGGAVRVAVGPNGQPWIVNSDGRIFNRSGSSWLVTAGTARDIAVASDGSVYIVGTTPRAGGFGIYRYIPDWNSWVEVGGGAVRIAAGKTVWVVNDNQRVFRGDPGGWVALPGIATDVGANGVETWITGTASVAGGYAVYRFDGVGWDRFDGGAVAVSVAPDGSPWVINTYQEIFRGKAFIDQRSCQVDTVEVPESSASVVATSLQPGESVQLLPDAGAKISGWFPFTVQNGPEGLTNLAPTSFPLPGARAYSLLVNTGSGWRYLGASSAWVQNTTGSAQQLRFRVNDDVPGNGSGGFAVGLTFTCRT